MKKLKEKFRKEIDILDARNVELDILAKQCIEITEQECMGFAEWIEKHCLMDWDVVDKLFYSYNGKAIYKVSELFQLYIKSKENENSNS